MRLAGVNVLVTGATGLIGQELTQQLLDGGHRVYGTVHDIEPASAVGWTPIRADVTDYRRVLEVVVDREIQQVYHLAAKSIVGSCKSDPLGCFAANVLGTANVLEAARHSEKVVGVLCMESDKAYGDGPIPYREDQALQPGSIYEASKAMVSHLVRCYHLNYGVPVLGVRCANVYGPRDRNLSRLVPGTVTRLLRGEQPVVTEGAEAFVREFIYVAKAAAIMRALMGVGPWGRSVNVGSGDVLRVDAAIRVICEEVGAPLGYEVGPRHAAFRETPAQSLDLSLLREILGDTLVDGASGFREGIRQTVAWYRGNA